MSNFFSINYAINIGDINYGMHVGADTIVNILHEARIQYLSSLGNFSEKQLNGSIGLIMSAIHIEFKQQLFHQDKIKIYVGLKEIKKIRFSLEYKIYKITENSEVLSHIAQTDMTCFNYTTQQIAPIPQDFLNQLTR